MTINNEVANAKNLDEYDLEQTFFDVYMLNVAANTLIEKLLEEDRATSKDASAARICIARAIEIVERQYPFFWSAEEIQEMQNEKYGSSPQQKEENE